MYEETWRPRVEVPELSRCCLCLPLRYGLLGWGYIKVILLLGGEFILFQELSYLKYRIKPTGIPPATVTFIIIMFVDLIFNIMFIVAGHMKHRLLYKIYVYYSIAFLVGFMIVWTAFLIDEIVDLKTYGMDTFQYVLFCLIFNLFAAAPVVVVQTYVTLLVRSELLKLNNTNVQFVNDVAIFVNAEEASTS